MPVRLTNTAVAAAATSRMMTGTGIWGHVTRTDVEERIGHAVDSHTAGPDDRDAVEQLQGAEGRKDRGDAQLRDDQPVEDAARRARREPDGA